jgi:hypothetical protein
MLQNIKTKPAVMELKKVFTLIFQKGTDFLECFG